MFEVGATTARGSAGRALDVLFVNPDSSAQAYQGLAATYSAIEPPTWALLLAQSCRAKGFVVAIIDCDAEKLSLEGAVARVRELKPRLVVSKCSFQEVNTVRFAPRCASPGSTSSATIFGFPDDTPETM
jgi:hypothetical protein